MRLGVILGVVCLLGLYGCGGEDEPDANSTAAAAPSGEVMASRGGPDYGASLDDYQDLNAEHSGLVLSYLVLARDSSDQRPSKENLLARLSPRYAQEPDAFARKSLVDSEWPAVAAKLNAFADTSYVKLPVGGELRQVLALNPPTVGDYSFEHRGFPLLSYGASCWNAVIRNGGGAVLRVEPGDVPCIVPVGDDDVARRIEAARASGNLQVKGVLYLFVHDVTQGVASAVPVHYSLEFLDVRAGVSLGTITL
jgi:hypothetical protein